MWNVRVWLISRWTSLGRANVSLASGWHRIIAGEPTSIGNVPFTAEGSVAVVLPFCVRG